ncbi:hypothetical protein NE237_017342 [Protea cynaroides]|uniref:Amino acid transporter transmembrane domain-containing protein n=1 Tax=Protea cynaroides TaxID=273540 RepID=A0A9Q0K7V0_9MAGN|nr:hypothetical protein NE237_017342 [Protea cynaroides]
MAILGLSGDDKKHRQSPRSPLLPHNHDEVEPVEVGFNGASFSGAFFNLSTTTVGAGIKALPATVKQLGLLPGLAMIILVAFLTESSIEMILRPTPSSKTSSYSTAVERLEVSAGRSCRWDVLSGTWSEGIHHTGVVEGCFGSHWWTSRFFMLLLTTLLVFAPLVSFSVYVNSLKYTSALSVALAIVFVVITMAVTVVKMVAGSIELPHLLPRVVDQASFWKLFMTIPVIVTTYICPHNGNLSNMMNLQLFFTALMKTIVRTSMVLCSSIYVATSLFGFMLFGEKMLDDVLANFDTNLGIPYSGIINDLMRISYGIHLMLRFVFFTVGPMLLIFLGANFIPSIWAAFQITGATATVSIGFIFPASIVLRDYSHGMSSNKDRLLSWVMIVLAVTSRIVAISCNIFSFFNDQPFS